MKRRMSLEIIMIMLGLFSYYMNNGSPFIQNVMMFCIGFLVFSFANSLDNLIKNKKEKENDRNKNI